MLRAAQFNMKICEKSVKNVKQEKPRQNERREQHEMTKKIIQYE